MGTHLDAREHYSPDGGMPNGCWPTLLAGPFIIAVAGGCGLHLLQKNSLYLVIWVPSIAAVLLGMAMWMIVVVAHCRRPFLVAVIGAAAGLVMYLGSYYFGMIAELPAGNAHRLDRLPAYVVGRLKTDVEQAVAIGHERPRNMPDFFTNSATFFLELSAAMIFAAGAPFWRARRPHEATLGLWMAREDKPIPTGLEVEFRQAFESSSLEAFAQRVSVELASANESKTAGHCGWCILEYIRNSHASPLEYPVFLSFISDAASAVGMYFGRKSSLRQLRLERAEAVAIRALFPKFDQILNSFPE